MQKQNRLLKAKKMKKIKNKSLKDYVSFKTVVVFQFFLLLSIVKWMKINQVHREPNKKVITFSCRLFLFPWMHKCAIRIGECINVKGVFRINEENWKKINEKRFFSQYDYDKNWQRMQPILHTHIQYFKDFKSE